MMTAFHNEIEHEAMASFVPTCPNEEELETTAPITTNTNKAPGDYMEDFEEVSSVTVSPSTSEDWSEEYSSDEDDLVDDHKVNGTGLILYVTPTATKASYWKRRLGWKPNMGKSATKKIKNIFRAPVRNHIRTGRYELSGADALAVDQTTTTTITTKKHRDTNNSINKKPLAGSKDDPFLEHETKDFEKLDVAEKLVFA